MEEATNEDKQTTSILKNFISLFSSLEWAEKKYYNSKLIILNMKQRQKLFGFVNV